MIPVISEAVLESELENSRMTGRRADAEFRVRPSKVKSTPRHRMTGDFKRFSPNRK